MLEHAIWDSLKPCSRTTATYMWLRINCVVHFEGRELCFAYVGPCVNVQIFTRERQGL